MRDHSYSVTVIITSWLIGYLQFTYGMPRCMMGVLGRYSYK